MNVYSCTKIVDNYVEKGLEMVLNCLSSNQFWLPA